MVNLCHMSRIAVWKHLTVDLLSADHIDILTVIFFQLFQYFLDTVHDDGTFDLIILIFRQDNVDSVFERQSVRKTLQCLSAHHNYFSGCHLTEHLHIVRNTDQQFIVLADRPVLIHSSNQIHLTYPPLFSFFTLFYPVNVFCHASFYTATGICLICGPVT